MVPVNASSARPARRSGVGKDYAELEGGVDMVALAKKLHRYPVNGMRRSPNDVADALAEAEYLSTTGNRFTRAAVSRMLNRKSEGKA
ncbi:hypothetical protein [Rhizobium mesoamericanum]|uniref:hypothetical protein n=1 Tax=Rhizobium mesoamericanum TaxID=1079800 RepID=UPI001F32FAA9|nr:hypothetical protein [Rhizobium mesoamericanum]